MHLPWLSRWSDVVARMWAPARPYDGGSDCDAGGRGSSATGAEAKQIATPAYGWLAMTEGESIVCKAKGMCASEPAQNR